jgi:hypothetical protein
VEGWVAGGIAVREIEHHSGEEGAEGGLQSCLRREGISTTALGSFTRFTVAGRMGAATAIMLIIGSPLKLTVLTGRTASGAEALVSP